MSETLDLRGLKCPLPALLAKKALAKAPAGSVLIVLADDPLAVVDIPHMCHAEGHGVDAVVPDGNHHSFTLRQVAGPVAGTIAAKDAR